MSRHCNNDLMGPTNRQPKRPTPATKINAIPFWTPRFWHGMRLGHWLRLVARNRFRIHPARLPRAVFITFAAAVNSAMAFLQRLFYGHRIAKTEIKQAPVFIIGHWRTGTTYLHELMVRDDRFAFPTTYECFAPGHFLITEWILPRLLSFLLPLPPTRPMDNMAVGFERPQEDEVALCVMGGPSLLLRTAFPNDPPPYMELLNMDEADEQLRSRWKHALRQFLKSLTLRKQKRLVLKSPSHTGRIRILSEMFPDARFIHLVRDPDSIFPSARRLWSALDEMQGLQLPRHESLDDYVFGAFERMYRGFDRQRESIDPTRICEVRYEDLVRDPISQVRTIYEKLDLGDFEHVREKLEEYVGCLRDYRPNEYEVEPETKEEIRRRWAGYIERYGYAKKRAPEGVLR